MRVFVLSDVHVDHPDNLAWIDNLSHTAYRNDALLLAGDVTHVLAKLEAALVLLQARFATLHYVPGNHELWRQNGEDLDSLTKFRQILVMCRRLGVHTEPIRLRGTTGVWIVPLFSWYTKPEQGEDSLFVNKPGEDPNLSIWSDNYFIKWPDSAVAAHPAAYFLGLNRTAISRTYDAPVISFSHFLPRRDLIFSRPADLTRRKLIDLHPDFNFSRVAGSQHLDRQIRLLRSVIHVYGHQHRNRYRLIDGILYVSACLGYGKERAHGFIRHMDQLPRLIWDTETVSGNVDIAQTSSVRIRSITSTHR